MSLQEYLNRPTARAAWWDSPNDHVLGGRDLLREIRGTWLGITKAGRIAVLTNFREQGQEYRGAISRGAMANAFLMQPPNELQDTKDFVKTLVENEGVSGIGGFSLVCGKIGEPLAVISNRTPDVKSTQWVAKTPGETVGLSNAAFGDRSWPKVVEGERLLASLISRDSENSSGKGQLVEEMMQILSIDTLPRRKKDEDFDSYIFQLRNSILIPVIGGEGIDGTQADSIASANNTQQIRVTGSSRTPKDNVGMGGFYGTQKQTVLLVDHKGHATFVERTLYDERGRNIPEQERDLVFEFDIW